MGEVYAIASQKGGVGKTTTAISLGAELTRRGNKVLLVDVDAQGSLTASLGYTEPDSMSTTLATVLERVVNETRFEPKRFGILHHAEGFEGYMETGIVSDGQVKRYYDYVILDCMPSLSLMTLNAFSAADRVIIPVQAAYLSLKGLEQLIKTIGKVKRNLNTRLGIAGILITMLDERTRYAREIVELLQNTYGDNLRVFDTRIPYSIRAAEATAEGVSIFTHDPKGKVAAAYRELAGEVVSYE